MEFTFFRIAILYILVILYIGEQLFWRQLINAKLNEEGQA